MSCVQYLLHVVVAVAVRTAPLAGVQPSAGPVRM
jgi:hypothetical protein